MQAQITAEREKRALIAASEGRKQEQINIASGAREAAIQKSEGERQAAINQAQGQAAAILAVADANAQAIQKIAAAIQSNGGMEAVNLKVAEQYVNAFGESGEAGHHADRAGQSVGHEFDDRVGARDREQGKGVADAR